jgi:hypothetical protein
MVLCQKIVDHYLLSAEKSYTDQNKNLNHLIIIKTYRKNTKTMHYGVLIHAF